MKKDDLLKMIEDIRRGVINNISLIPLKAYFGFDGEIIEFRFCFIPVTSKKFNGTYYTILLREILN